MNDDKAPDSSDVEVRMMDSFLGQGTYEGRACNELGSYRPTLRTLPRNTKRFFVRAENSKHQIRCVLDRSAAAANDTQSSSTVSLKGVAMISSTTKIPCITMRISFGSLLSTVLSVATAQHTDYQPHYLVGLLNYNVR
jgi:hypothetical protein